MTEYSFARACALAWFNLNKIPVKESATAIQIAKRIACWDGRGGSSAAKRSVIEWHERAMTSNTQPATTAEDFYASQAWRRARYEALRRCRGVCELCGSPPIAHSLQVDHIRPRSKYPELALEPTNLQVLCRDCNFGKSNRDSIDWRR